jgi:hypothetical protein
VLSFSGAPLMRGLPARWNARSANRDHGTARMGPWSENSKSGEIALG